MFEGATAFLVGLIAVVVVEKIFDGREKEGAEFPSLAISMTVAFFFDERGKKRLGKILGFRGVAFLTKDEGVDRRAVAFAEDRESVIGPLR